jgi:uncharacterized protein YqgV (UPF0045/DUF77 family)
MTEHQEPALTPQVIKTVDFYGDGITVALVGDDVYVPLRALTDFLGVDWTAQWRRVQRDVVLARYVRQVTMTGADGKQRDLVCLPLEYLPGWLFGITTSRLRPELQEKLTRYREECFRVLWNAFKHDIVPAADLVAQERPKSGAELALDIATAIQHLAQQQLDIERRLEGVHGRMDSMARWATQVERRISGLELQINPEETITEAQANEIALAVKTVAAALEASGTKNGYQRVYAELYRRERIGAYRKLAQGRYQAVLDWLHQWHAEVAGEATAT